MRFTIKGLEVSIKGLKFNGEKESGIVEDGSMKIESIEVECKLAEVKEIAKEVMNVFVQQNSVQPSRYTPTVYRCACGNKVGLDMLGEHCEKCETNVEEIKPMSL